MNTIPNAPDVALRAIQAVQRGARDEWLALFSADAVLEDPVGAPPRVGAEQIADFWDTGIAGLDEVRFDVGRVHDAPGEAIVLAEISIRATGGAAATYDSAIHYSLDEDGTIGSLRAFWDLDDVLRQLTPPR